MSKERLEEIKSNAIKEKVHVKTLGTRKSGYWTESYEILKDDWRWLIEQVERNVTAQETVEILGESLKQSIEQNKRYRELLESIRYTQDIAKEIQAEKPNIKVITPDDLLQHMLRKVNKELESELNA